MLKPEYPFLSILCLSIILLSCGDILNPPEQSLILKSPNGGEQWEMGSQQQITWSSHDVKYIEIQYSIDGGINWEWIISEKDSGGLYLASKGSYLWTLPIVISDKAIVKINEFIPNQGMGKIDQSDACFSIIGNEQLNNALKYYPLTPGNKWIYNSSWTYWDHDQLKYITIFYLTIIEAKKDTVMSNNKKYTKLITSINNQKIKNYFYLSLIDYQRIETSTCKIYRFDLEFPTRDFEYLIDDLFASPGSMVKSHRFMLPAYYTWAYSGGTEVMLEKKINIFNRLTSLREYSERDNWHSDIYQLVKDIGLYYHKYQGEFSTYIEELKGCVINSEVLGDTTVTSQSFKIGN